MPQKLALLLLSFGLLTSCGQSNPIVGVWVIDEEASSTSAQAAAGLSGIERIEFREDKLVIGNKSVTVSYEVDGDRVIVTEDAAGSGEVYTIVDEGRVEKQLPMGIVLVYTREVSSPLIAEDES